MHCGQSIADPKVPNQVLNGTRAGSMAVQLDEQLKRRSLWVTAVIAVVAVLALFFAMKASGILGASGRTANNKSLEAQGATPGGKLLTAEGSTPGGVLMTPGKTGGGVLEKGGQGREPMPKDVFDWLKHLEECERRKTVIAGDQTAEMSLWMQKNSVLGAGMGMMDPYDQATNDEGKDPATYTKGKILDLRPAWADLVRYFRSYPPPAECRPIANDFDGAMTEIPGMMGDLGDILNGAMTGPDDAMKKLKKLQNTSYGDVDRYFARCDQKLTAICAKYGVNKWFNVKQDVMSGGIMGQMPSLTGGGSGTLPGNGMNTIPDVGH